MLWGPRVGGYFDQIVLSGITPLRFLIGKATSQNLLLGLALFLLVPYMVLSLTLGGVEFEYLIAALILVWLYCMMLALVTLWLSLYLNELLSGLIVVGAAGALLGFGVFPVSNQPFVVTPMPVLIYPVLKAIPSVSEFVTRSFWEVFAACSIGMTAVSSGALLGLYMGPLYGIIRENSMFGEVVRQGDTKRKRWFRVRLHIQRPSEIASFYENRGSALQKHEGIVRWGLSFIGLCAATVAVYMIFDFTMRQMMPRALMGRGSEWFAEEFHILRASIHAGSLVLAMFVFSHPKNTTCLKIPFVLGKRVEVSRIDTISFISFAALSTIATIAIAHAYEIYVAVPSSATIFPIGNSGDLNFRRVLMEGSVVTLLAACVIYAMHRVTSAAVWLKSFSLVTIGGVYLGLFLLVPMVSAMALFELRDLRDFVDISILETVGSYMVVTSPIGTHIRLYGEMGGHFDPTVPTVPFYIAHIPILVILMIVHWRLLTGLRKQYLNESVAETKI